MSPLALGPPANPAHAAAYAAAPRAVKLLAMNRAVDEFEAAGIHNPTALRDRMYALASGSRVRECAAPFCTPLTPLCSKHIAEASGRLPK